MTFLIGFNRVHNIFSDPITLFSSTEHYKGIKKGKREKSHSIKTRHHHKPRGEKTPARSFTACCIFTSGKADNYLKEIFLTKIDQAYNLRLNSSFLNCHALTSFICFFFPSATIYCFSKAFTIPFSFTVVDKKLREAAEYAIIETTYVMIY